MTKKGMKKWTEPPVELSIDVPFLAAIENSNIRDHSR
jgi:hypothetical protein